MASSNRATIFPGADRLSHLRKELAPPRNIKGDVPKVEEVPKSMGTKRDGTVVPLASPSPPLPERHVPILHRSPWDHYERAYDIELGGSITRVSKIPETKHMFTMRRLSGYDAQKKIDTLCRLKHKNVLATYEVFIHSNEFYVISEDTEVSLEEFIIARPDEAQLAAIISQVLEAIIYLESQGTLHGNINLSNIVLTKTGIAKITNLESCSEIDSKDRQTDVQALGKVMQQLMENGTAPEKLGLRDVSRWSDNAVQFLALTMSESARQLAKHPFLKNPTISKLVKLVSLAGVSACRFYRV